MAEKRDLYAMECLGLRLCNGNGVTKAPEEGLGWLKKSAELGSAVAMARLAECLLETGQTAHVSAEAQQWLHRSIQHGYRQAAVILGSRLIVGAGMALDPQQGQQLLIEAAKQGSQLAHVKLGVYLLSGQGLSQNRNEGLRWLRRIGATEANHISQLASYVHIKSIAAATPGSARILAEEAAVLYFESVQRGNRGEEVNLAYLLRRKEISPSPYPSIETLLATHLQQGNPVAAVNQALRLAAGIGCAIDWHAADTLISKIRAGTAVLKGWWARSQEGDPESHLVTAWLVRHGLTIDPDKIPLRDRMDLARDGGWTVPDWMNCAATRGQQNL